VRSRLHKLETLVRRHDAPLMQLSHTMAMRVQSQRGSLSVEGPITCTLGYSTCDATEQCRMPYSYSKLHRVDYASVGSVVLREQCRLPDTILGTHFNDYSINCILGQQCTACIQARSQGCFQSHSNVMLACVQGCRFFLLSHRGVFPLVLGLSAASALHS
jgi:hypothetical protein